MAKCDNCGADFTLGKGEIKCDKCNKIVHFICHKCKQQFSIESQPLCDVCGFYECPNCCVCGSECQKTEWENSIRGISSSLTDEQMKKIVILIADIKLGHIRRECERGVSIAYAKSRIKRCFVKLNGFRARDNEDLSKFKERYDTILSKSIGEKFTITKTKELGSYGQEYRDVFNLLICQGKLKKIKIKKNIDGEDIDYDAFERCNINTCHLFDTTNLIKKQCQNKNCQAQINSLSQDYCSSPDCVYKKGPKKGQPKKLKLKISNENTCRLDRKDFIIDEKYLKT